MNAHKESLTGFILTVAGILLLIISGITSFGFFEANFAGFISYEIAGSYTGVIAGLIGMFVFDIMAIVWLFAFLYRADTPEQRAISLLMLTVCFVFSAIASGAHIYLTSSDTIRISEELLVTLGNLATIGSILGIVANFGSSISYTRYSYESKQRVREASRRDAIQRAEEEHSTYLDNLIGQKVKGKLKERADHLSELQAGRIADRYTDLEESKYTPRLPDPLGSNGKQFKAVPRSQRNGRPSSPLSRRG